MRVRLQIARSQREYAEVIVEAPSIEAAQDYVELLLNGETYSEAYCDMVNNVVWNRDPETFDEDVIDAEECERQDVEVDVTVPADAGTYSVRITLPDGSTQSYSRAFTSEAAARLDATNFYPDGTVEIQRQTEPKATYECDNCSKRWTEAELRPAANLSERMDEDGDEPDGECPECGALCYAVESADEPLVTVAVGDRVYWRDPAQDHGDEDCSGPGTVVSIGVEAGAAIEDDTIIALKKDDEGEVECFLHELRAITTTDEDDPNTPQPAGDRYVINEDEENRTRANFNAAAAFDAIRERLDGVCSHDNGTDPDCFVCQAYLIAVAGVRGEDPINEDEEKS